MTVQVDLISVKTSVTNLEQAKPLSSEQLLYSLCHLPVCRCIMQTELRTKAATIEKNKSQVKVALGLVASVNPEGLSSADWKIDLTQKLQERIDLQQQRDKLQQASIVLCIPAVNAAVLLLQQRNILKLRLNRL